MSQLKKLSVAALGGVYEIGKNMYVVRYGEDIIIIDCGSKFPDESLLGIDLIIPDITYLLSHADQVKALVVTHGHEDHIGGIPYLLKRLPVPVYASGLTIGLIETKLKEHKLFARSELHLIHAGSVLEIGQMRISFFKTNHSIPDCLGIVVETPDGNVVHTGDFKFDFTPVNQAYPDLQRMAEIGSRGVHLLLSESTNAERSGFTPSERNVGEHIREAFLKADRKIVISTFASNVHRIQQIVDAAAASRRRLTLLGRSMVNVVAVAQELGYLNVPKEMLVPVEEAASMPPGEVVVLCTGSQGEPMAALARLARGDQRQIEIGAGDTVIIAATPIPGNERNVARIVDQLYQLKAKVIYGAGSSTGMHVSGHGSQEELKLMLTLMKPVHFMPIHGEYRMLYQHALLAESVGVQPENIFIVNNGEVVEVSEGKARLSGKVTAGNTFVDGLGIGDIGSVVLRDRKQLSEDGILILVITLSKSESKLLAPPDAISRGFVYVRNSEELMLEINGLVMSELTKLLEAGTTQWSVLKQTLKESLGTFLFVRTGRRPMILPVIIEV